MLVRYLVFIVFAACACAAVASWLVRTRRVSPFGTLGRILRAASDTLIRPVEVRLLRVGGNPVHAGWWLVITVAVAGIALLWLLDWVVRTVGRAEAALAGGPQAVLAFLIDAAYRVLVAALIVRVLGSWLGAFRHARWMRPAYRLTDWFVEPIRRVLPPMGSLDWSPLVAWLALLILKQLLLSLVVLF